MTENVDLQGKQRTRRGIHEECLALTLGNYETYACANCVDVVNQAFHIGRKIALRELRLDPEANVWDETPEVDWLFGEEGDL